MELLGLLLNIWTLRIVFTISDAVICKYFKPSWTFFLLFSLQILSIYVTIIFSIHSLYSINLCGILDHFRYKAPDFSFIHESIWYDLGHFENWLIDRRGLNLGDVVPFRSQRLPGPTFRMSDGSQTSASEEEEPFISASSMASKAAPLPENLNGSEWEPPSSKATAGSNLAISSIERLDGI